MCGEMQFTVNRNYIFSLLWITFGRLVNIQYFIPLSPAVKPYNAFNKPAIESPFMETNPPVPLPPPSSLLKLLIIVFANRYAEFFLVIFHIHVFQD